MEAGFIEFCNIVFRCVHVVAAIMWIGDSLLFTWMEINLLENEEDADTLGYMNMLHGGGVFFLQKRILRPDRIPDRLHIFKWQSYTTWLSGFFLLSTVFYTRSGSLLLDASKTDLPGYMGAVISVGGLLAGWIFYDLLWRSPIRHRPTFAIAMSLSAFFAYGAWLDTLFVGRAVYLQMGATLATLMTANVFIHIMTNQRRMMAALKAGKPHNLELGKFAKTRSTHNHYITFPVIFLMLSSHFPSTYGNSRRIAIAVIIILGLMIIKHLMNIYRGFHRWKECIALTFALIVGGTYGLMQLDSVAAHPSQHSDIEEAELVAEGLALFNKVGCPTCHLPADSTTAPSLHLLVGKTRKFKGGNQLTADEAYIRESIRFSQARVVEGQATTMPQYHGVLSDEDIDALVAYVKSLSP